MSDVLLQLIISPSTDIEAASLYQKQVLKLLLIVFVVIFVSTESHCSQLCTYVSAYVAIYSAFQILLQSTGLH